MVLIIALSVLRRLSKMVQALDPDLCMGCLNLAGNVG